MTIIPLQPDIASPLTRTTPQATSPFSRMLDDIRATLEHAQDSEDRFSRGEGSLRSAIYDRVRADLTLNVATAAVSRTVQSLQSILQMQI